MKSALCEVFRENNMFGTKLPLNDLLKRVPAAPATEVAKALASKWFTGQKQKQEGPLILLPNLHPITHS